MNLSQMQQKQKLIPISQFQHQGSAQSTSFLQPNQQTLSSSSNTKNGNLAPPCYLNGYYFGSANLSNTQMTLDYHNQTIPKQSISFGGIISENIHSKQNVNAQNQSSLLVNQENSLNQSSQRFQKSFADNKNQFYFSQSSLIKTAAIEVNNSRKNQSKFQRSPLLQSLSHQQQKAVNNSLSGKFNQSNSQNVQENSDFLKSKNNQISVNIPVSDLEQQRFIKKTQHVIKGIPAHIQSQQEDLQDLDESVKVMIKEMGLYEQAQRGVIPNEDPAKSSLKRNGNVCCYAAKTHQGLVRNYNEDRVSIILNIMKPSCKQNEDNWPKCSFFGVYDGHGGVSCADFLRDHLHQFVINDQNFPQNPVQAIKNGFEQAEIQFLKQAQVNQGGQIDRSGSCAIVVIIVEDTCYVANVGDSRAVISQDGGKNIFSLTRDHKPMDEVENKRIHENGGTVYQTKIESHSIDKKNPDTQIIIGPYRVLPGRLSVTRTFGDIEAKSVKYGGNPKVVISTPDIKQFKIVQNHDFIIIGCKNTFLGIDADISQICVGDGIFDKMTSEEVGRVVWETSKNEQLGNNVHNFCARSVDNIMKLSAARKTLDNITVVIVGFENIENSLFGLPPSNSNGTQIVSHTLSQENNHNNTLQIDNPLSLNMSNAQLKVNQSSQGVLSPKKAFQIELNSKQFDVKSNAPNQQVSSILSPYLSCQQVAFPLAQKDGNVEQFNLKHAHVSPIDQNSQQVDCSSQKQKVVDAQTQQIGGQMIPAVIQNLQKNDYTQRIGLPQSRSGNISRTSKSGIDYQQNTMIPFPHNGTHKQIKFHQNSTNTTRKTEFNLNSSHLSPKSLRETQFSQSINEAKYRQKHIQNIITN